MKTKFREGDFVVTHDWRRGFVLSATSKKFGETIYTVLMLQFNLMDRPPDAAMYREGLLSLSGVEPSERELAAFVRYHIAH